MNFRLNDLNDFGSIHLSGNAALAGIFNVTLQSGYSPAVSNSFAVVNYGSETGTFTALNLPHLTQGLTWQSGYGDNALTLTVIAVPPPSVSVPGKISGNQLSLAWSAVPGQWYQVQYTTNVSPATWRNLGSPIQATNDTMITSDAVDLDPQRYYRVILP